MNINYDIQLKVATVQAEPVWMDADKTIDKTICFIEEAAKNGAKLIAFPECWVPGYHWQCWVGSALYAMSFSRKYIQNALVLGDARMRRVMKAARDNGIYVVLGYVERNGGSLYIAQAFISNNGEILGNRRKLKPTYIERGTYGEGCGADMVVWDSPVGKVGGLNCFEHFQPLEIYAMSAMYEQIHVASWPSFCLYRDTFCYGCSFIEPNEQVTHMYAMFTQSFVLCATSTIGPLAHESFCRNEEERRLLGTGGGFARIYHPSGVDLAPHHLAPDAEGLLYADIDLRDILDAKAFVDPVGQYSRPDVLSLTIDRTPRPHARILGEPPCDDAIGEANAAFRAALRKEEDA